MQDRYSRQVILPNIGEEGQKTLLKSKIAIIGCGALGTVVAKKEIITLLCGRNAIQITPAEPGEISFKLLAERLKQLGEVRFNNFILVFKERDKEISLFKDGRAIIKGTDDEKVARSLYARFVGI